MAREDQDRAKTPAVANEGQWDRRNSSSGPEEAEAGSEVADGAAAGLSAAISEPAEREWGCRMSLQRLESPIDPVTFTAFLGSCSQKQKRLPVTVAFSW
jgi:hypothetical protein